MEMKTEDTLVRCDGMEEDGAPFSSPYRHYARVRCAHGIRLWFVRPHLPPLRTREVRTAHYAPRPVVRSNYACHNTREIRTRITRAARWGHRALPPLRTHGAHAHYPGALHPHAVGNPKSSAAGDMRKAGFVSARFQVT